MRHDVGLTTPDRGQLKFLINNNTLYFTHPHAYTGIHLTCIYIRERERFVYQRSVLADLWKWLTTYSATSWHMNRHIDAHICKQPRAHTRARYSHASGGACTVSEYRKQTLWGEKVLVYGTFSSPVGGKVDECKQVHGEMSGAKTLPCTLATPCHVIQKRFANPLRNLFFFLHSICALTNTFSQWWNMGCLPLAVNQLELMLCIILQNVRSSAAFKAELMADEVTENHMPDLLWCLEMV